MATTDITSGILADSGADNIDLSGASAIALSSATTATYSGVLAGKGTLEIGGTGSTLILTGTSTFTLPTITESLSGKYVSLAYGTYDGYPSSHGFRGAAYTFKTTDGPAVTIDAGATLQLGTSSSFGTVSSTTTGGVNLDNVEVDGTLKVNGTHVLGLLSGTGNAIFDIGSQVTLYGDNTISGVIVNLDQLTLGSDHIYGSLDDISAIFNNGTIILDTPYNDTMELSANIYENHWGNDININASGGTIVLSGVYSYTDSTSDNANSVASYDKYSLDPELSDASLNYTEISGNRSGRGINVEGGTVQLGNGTTTDFFLPGNSGTVYIDLRSNGLLGFDYASTGPTYDNAIIAGGGLSFYSLNSVGTGTVIFKAGDIVITQQQYYNGTTQIDAGAIVQLGDGTTGDTTTTSVGIHQTSAGDGGFLEAGETVTVESLDGRDGSTSTGATTNNLINNGTLIIDNAGATYLNDVSGAGILVQAGAGVTSLGSGTTFTGATEIYGGTLALLSGASLAASSEVELLATNASPVEGPQDTASTVVSVGAAVFDISQAGDQTIQALSGVAGTMVDLGAATLTVGDSASTTYAGIIADGGISDGIGGGLIKVGSGTLTLTGVETYTGATTIEAGTLLVGTGGSIATSESVDLSVSGASLVFSGAGSITIQDLTGVSGTLVTHAGQYLTIVESDDTTFSGTLTASGLIKTGDGTLTITSDLAGVTGNILVQDGTLALSSSSAMHGHILTLSGDGIADFSEVGGMSIETIGGASGTEILLGAGQLTLNAAHSTTYAGTIADGSEAAGSIQKRGAASLTLSGVNTYSGGTLLQAGTLELTNANAAGTGEIDFYKSTRNGANLILDAGVTNTIGTVYNNDHIYVGGFTKGDSLTTSYNSSTGVYTIADSHDHAVSLTFTDASEIALSSTSVNAKGYAVLTGTKAA